MLKKVYPALYAAICKSGYLQAEVAAGIGISPQAMSDKMTGRSCFTIREVTAIGLFLNLSPEQYYSLFIRPLETSVKIKRI